MSINNTMNISFTGTNIDVTDALRDYTTKKFQALKKHADKFGAVNVKFAMEAKVHKAEAIVNIPGNQFFAEATSNQDMNEDMYAAIDRLADKLVAQLKKHRDKQTHHHRSLEKNIPPTPPTN